MKKLFPTSIATFQLIAQASRVKAFSCLITIFFASCAVLDTHQAKLDQQQLREVLMDYTQDQILDNLIRASNGLPIVHFDLSNITGQVTLKFTPTVGGGRNVTDVRTRTPTHNTVITNQTTGSTSTTTNPVNQTVMSSAMHTIASTVSVVSGLVETVAMPFSWGVGAERDNGISIQADPLIADPDVYAAYIKFLNTDVITGESEIIPSPADTKDDTRNGNKVTEIPTTQPTAVKTNTVMDPAETTSPAQNPTELPPTMTELAKPSSTAEKKTAPPPATKPCSKDENRLVIKSFRDIKSLEKTPTAPAPADVLVGPKRWKDGMYYWVPKTYQRQFFALCMATVARCVPAQTDAVSRAVKENTATIRRQQLQ